MFKVWGVGFRFRVEGGSGLRDPMSIRGLQVVPLSRTLKTRCLRNSLLDAVGASKVQAVGTA